MAHYMYLSPSNKSTGLNNVINKWGNAGLGFKGIKKNPPLSPTPHSALSCNYMLGCRELIESGLFNLFTVEP